MWELRQSGRLPCYAVLMLLFCSLLVSALSPAHAGRLEAGSFTAHQTTGSGSGPVTVNFQQTFDTIPIVVALSDQRGGDAASIRITNVTTTGFDELILETDSHDGPHASQNVHYLAVEPGRHVLPDGSIVEAGRLNTSVVQFGTGFTGSTASWATVNFSNTLPTTPSVVTQIQTANSETRTVASQTSRPHITAIAQDLGMTSFQVALERSQASSGPWPSTETIGWIAFPADISGTFLDVSSNTITWSTANTVANIRGTNNGCFNNAFGQISATRIVVAKKNSRNNPDGGWFRRCRLNSSVIGLRVEEDRDQDSERSLTVAESESASIVAFSGAFHALLEPNLSVTKTSLSFNDGLGSDFALPGGTLDYIIIVQNDGNAPPNHDTVVVTETLPSEISLIVTDFGAPGSGPIQYQDGSPASDLLCPFISLASTADCFAFSNDGVNFNHIPSDSGDGTDPAITHVRAIPTGFMKPNTGIGATSFSLRFKGKID